MGVIEDDKMLYGYDLNGASGFIVHDMGTYYEFTMPSSDVHISPVYKYVIDEVTVLNVIHPAAGSALIENKECAPEDANYIVTSNSLWYKIDGTRALINTFDPSNPYIFVNNMIYEVEICFRVPSDNDYLLNQNGFNRDGNYQFVIDGLDFSEYEVVDCNFTNSSKELYKVTLRFNSITKYEVNVTNGNASIGGGIITYAAPDSVVLLSANVAPSGKAFDKWVVTGITVDEDALCGSKLAITMPNNTVTAEATYKDVEYFEVTFSPNGGTGLISDDISYGDYILPSCSFEAPEHKHFKCWDVNGVEYNELVEITVTENIEVKAIWEIDKFTVSFDNNGGAGSMDAETKEYGSTFTLPECTFAAPEHKHFIGWSLEAEDEVISESSITITDNVTLYAIYATDTFTISFNNNGGTGSMDEETKTYGSTFILPECTFTAPTNKRFAGWSKEAEGSIITTTTIEITSDVALYAIYEEMPVDVTLTKIELSGTYKTKYTVGDTFSSDGIVVTATYSDNTTQNIALSLVTISGYNLSNEGTQTVTVTYEGKTATFTITVEKKSTPDPVDPVDPVNPDPVTPDDPTPSPKKKNNAGLIIGITLGSVALCAAIAVGAVLIIKKKH